MAVSDEFPDALFHQRRPELATFDEVLRAARAGDGWAFERLFDDLQRPLQMLALAAGSSDPDGLVNEVLVEVFMTLPTFRGDQRAFRAVVFAAAHRRLAGSTPSAPPGVMPDRSVAEVAVHLDGEGRFDPPPVVVSTVLAEFVVRPTEREEVDADHIIDLEPMIVLEPTTHPVEVDCARTRGGSWRGALTRRVGVTIAIALAFVAFVVAVLHATGTVRFSARPGERDPVEVIVRGDVGHLDDGSAPAASPAPPSVRAGSRGAPLGS